jgi:hypothetical protein
VNHRRLPSFDRPSRTVLDALDGPRATARVSIRNTRCWRGGQFLRPHRPGHYRSWTVPGWTQPRGAAMSFDYRIRPKPGDCLAGWGRLSRGEGIPRDAGAACRPKGVDNSQPPRGAARRDGFTRAAAPAVAVVRATCRRLSPCEFRSLLVGPGGRRYVIAVGIPPWAGNLRRRARGCPGGLRPRQIYNVRRPQDRRAPNFRCGQQNRDF